MKLSTYIHQFFDQYLPRIKGVSNNTIQSYRDTFSLLLVFAAQHHCIKVDSLRLEHLSSRLILAFLDYLEQDRNNTARSRNQRLAVIKSLAKMIRLMHPENRQLAEKILNIPQKRTQKRLIGFLVHEEVMKVFQTVDLKKAGGFRDYTILHLLYDAGIRATELATLKVDYFDSAKGTLAILGKANRYRQVELRPKTAQLIQAYIAKYRTAPKPLYRQCLFINQRGQELTRHGIHRLCKKYLSEALPEKRLKELSPAHSFRHACAVSMLRGGKDISEIKNRLGHENVQSTMTYLHLDLSRSRQIQKQFLRYSQSIMGEDPKIDELIGWENKAETLAWLDSL